MEGRREGLGLEVKFEDVRKGEEFFRCVLVRLQGLSLPPPLFLCSNLDPLLLKRC